MVAPDSVNPKPGISGDLAAAIDKYIGKIFEKYPLSPEQRLRREKELRREVMLFIEDVRRTIPDGIDDGELTEILYEEFGDPDLLRDLNMRADSLEASFDWKCVLAPLSAAVFFGVVAVVLHGAEFLVAWHAPGAADAVSAGVSIALLLAAPLTGIAGFAAYLALGGNRYRFGPFVFVSVLVFFLAGSTGARIDILERAPEARYHLFISLAVPLMGMDFAPAIRRYIVDIDRTGLPREYTRSRSFLTAVEEAPSGLVRVFWLLFAGVGVANYFALSRIAHDLRRYDEPVHAAAA